MSDATRVITAQGLGRSSASDYKGHEAKLPTIKAVQLTKRYGDTVAVDDLSFEIHPGRVTGFLGPNGAGKTTTMRMIVGLDAPTAGSVTINGRRFRDLAVPLSEVGALLDAKALHGGRSAHDHLRILAASNGLPDSRVSEVLRIVGLKDVAHRRAGGFSLGMGQRLGIAAALLGDPGILMFDEPVNGLDPEGIVWVRHLMKKLAGEGRTVLVSSHLMSEMALTADHLLVIGKGRLIASAATQDFIDQSSEQSVLVRSDDDEALARQVTELGASVERAMGGGFEVSGIPSDAVGKLALSGGIILSELTPRKASLGDC